MPLNKVTLQSDIEKALVDVWDALSDQATNENYEQDPKKVIADTAKKISQGISNAVDKYIKSGDIIIGQANIIVVSPVGACTVTPVSPAKVS